MSDRVPMMRGEKVNLNRPCILYTHQGTLLGVNINGIRVNDTFRYLKIDEEERFWVGADGVAWYPLEERDMAPEYTMGDLEKRLHEGEITEAEYKRLRDKLDIHNALALNDIVVDPELGIDGDMEEVSENVLQKVIQVVNDIRRVKEGPIPEDDLYETLGTDYGIAKLVAARYLSVLVKNKVIYCPEPGFYDLVEEEPELLAVGATLEEENKDE